MMLAKANADANESHTDRVVASAQEEIRRLSRGCDALQPDSTTSISSGLSIVGKLRDLGVGLAAFYRLRQSFATLLELGRERHRGLVRVPQGGFGLLLLSIGQVEKSGNSVKPLLHMLPPRDGGLREYDTGGQYHGADRNGPFGFHVCSS